VKITGYDLVHVTHDGHGNVNITGAALPGGTAIVWLHIRHEHLGYHAAELIWRAVRDAGHVVLVGLADVRHELAADLADRDGQARPPQIPTAVTDALAEGDAYDEILGEIAEIREYLTAVLDAGEVPA